MKKRVIFFLFLVIIFSLGGCRQTYSQDGIGAHIVQKIDFFTDYGAAAVRRSYVSTQQIRLILLCMRDLGPGFPPRADVDALDEKIMTLSLHCADGTISTYHFKGGLYMQKNDGAWRQISQERVGALYQLLMFLPGNGEKTGIADLPTDAQTRRVYFPVYRRMAEANR